MSNDKFDLEGLGDLGDLGDEAEKPTEKGRKAASPKGEQQTLAQSRQRDRRVTHAQDTWDNYDVHNLEDKPWVRPTSLEAPTPRPGFKQRWIRVALHGVADETNAMRRLREGWKPRPRDSVPADFPIPTISHGEFAGCIGVEGMVLCEMPIPLINRREKFYRDKTDKITNSVDEELGRQNDPRMQITQERKSESRIVREVKVAPDD